MVDEVRVHKPPVQDEIEAWDKFASAALTAVCTSRPITDENAAEVAARFADALLVKRRLKLEELRNEAIERSNAAFGF